jgi:hypothetical protein
MTIHAQEREEEEEEEEEEEKERERERERYVLLNKTKQCFDLRLSYHPGILFVEHERQG